MAKPNWKFDRKTWSYYFREPTVPVTKKWSPKRLGLRLQACWWILFGRQPGVTWSNFHNKWWKENGVTHTELRFFYKRSRKREVWNQDGHWAYGYWGGNNYDKFCIKPRIKTDKEAKKFLSPVRKTKAKAKAAFMAKRERKGL